MVRKILKNGRTLKRSKKGEVIGVKASDSGKIENANSVPKIDAPGWLVAGIGLFAVFVQAVISSNGDYLTAMHIIYIADKTKLLSLAVTTLAMVFVPYVMMMYWGMSRGLLKRRDRVCYGVVANIVVLPFLPWSISVATLFLQVLIMIMSYRKREGGFAFTRLGIIVLSVYLVLFSMLYPGLNSQAQITHLKDGEGVIIGPVVGETSMGVAILSYCFRSSLHSGGQVSSGCHFPSYLTHQSTLSKDVKSFKVMKAGSKVVVVPKEKILRSRFCKVDSYSMLAEKPLYAVVFPNQIASEEACIELYFKDGAPDFYFD